MVTTVTEPATHNPTDVTFEAFVLEAISFRGGATITIWAHEPYNQEMKLFIPAALGGTDTTIDWSNLNKHAGALDARFTLDVNLSVTGWAVGDINYYNKVSIKKKSKR